MLVRFSSIYIRYAVVASVCGIHNRKVNLNGNEFLEVTKPWLRLYLKERNHT
jgi:hypothetical protein